MSYREGKVYKVAVMSTGGAQYLKRPFEGQEEQSTRPTPTTASCARKMKMNGEKKVKKGKSVKKEEIDNDSGAEDCGPIYLPPTIYDDLGWTLTPRQVETLPVDAEMKDALAEEVKGEDQPIIKKRRSEA